MLRNLIQALEGTSVVHDDQDAARLLVANGCPPDVAGIVTSLLADEQSVLRSGRGRLFLYSGGDDWEGWFEVEPTGFRCLYRH